MFAGRTWGVRRESVGGQWEGACERLSVEFKGHGCAKGCATAPRGPFEQEALSAIIALRSKTLLRLLVGV